MALDFSSMKSNRGNFGSLMKEVEKIAQPASQESKKDERFWQPEVDKAGNGYAVIRFLPPPAGEELPWARVWSHGFKGPSGKWYIENSLTTLNKADPVSELNSELWNSGSEANKEIARNQKRKLNYFANIYVVSDSKHPENEGKVFLFKFGKKIFDKIKDVMQPQFEDEEPINPFDFWKGANFKLKIRNVEGYRNYDKSEFEAVGPLFEDDAEMEAVWKKQYSLTEFTAADQFKSYDELKAKLNAVLSTAAAPRAEAVSLEDDEPVARAAAPAPKPKAAPVKEVDFEDDDESLSYFAKLANDE